MHSEFEMSMMGKSIYSTMYRGMIGEGRLPPGHRTSAQLSHLSRRFAERRGLTLPYSTSWRIISDTNKSFLRERATYGIGGPIISTVREVKNYLDPESICRIFDIAPIGFRVCPGDGQTIGSQLDRDQQSTTPHDLLYPTTTGRHRDEVSYYEAFFMDSILTGRRIQLGYLMMIHMISCCESKTRVLLYGCFLTRVFKDVGVDLSKETNFEAPSIYDMYDDLSMSGPSSQPLFTELPHIEIPPRQAFHVPDHTPWMDLSAQMSSLGTRMKELAIVGDTRFYSIEDHMDQYQADFISRFDRIEDHMDQQ
ncbi:hypothetical protein CK203_013753 [Vitis vinifera]|uniref:Uncharacterized protein n=1 Tax=Vitis vinifera TaxID=29760 RepID=A0A438JJK0_VITVI|nr:hypothetical protein CK203_013753 [Vitis vinifera]